MKFLVIGKLKEYPPVPPKQYIEMYIGECQTVMGFKKEGKTEVSYALAGLKAGMGIFEAESGAEINAMMTSLPFYPFLDVQIYPLLEWEEALAQAKQALEAL